jgi:HEPN domain-containing protein
MKKLAEDWLVHADKDLKTIVKILDEDYLSNVVAFHSHQCIEKCFKALILLKTGQVSKIHNLLKLFGTVRNHYTLNIDIVLLEEVNETYIDTRYPADLGLTPEGNLSPEKVREFYRFADGLFSQIESIVKKF